MNLIHSIEERRKVIEGTEYEEDLPIPTTLDPYDLIEEKSESTWIDEVKMGTLSESQKDKMKKMLTENRQAFSLNPEELGCCKYLRYDLQLVDETVVIADKPRRLPSNKRWFAADHMEKLLKAGIIRPSTSPFLANVVMAEKKTEPGKIDYRLCIDYRKCNTQTLRYQFPSSKASESISRLGRAVFRTQLDFK